MINKKWARVRLVPGTDQYDVSIRSFAVFAAISQRKLGIISMNFHFDIIPETALVQHRQCGINGEEIDKHAA